MCGRSTIALNTNVPIRIVVIGAPHHLICGVRVGGPNKMVLIDFSAARSPRLLGSKSRARIAVLSSL
jgi:hypothetical protein